MEFAQHFLCSCHGVEKNYLQYPVNSWFSFDERVLTSPKAGDIGVIFGSSGDSNVQIGILSSS